MMWPDHTTTNPGSIVRGAWALRRLDKAWYPHRDWTRTPLWQLTKAMHECDVTGIETYICGHSRRWDAYTFYRAAWALQTIAYRAQHDIPELALLAQRTSMVHCGAVTTRRGQTRALLAIGLRTGQLTSEAHFWLTSELYSDAIPCLEVRTAQQWLTGIASASQQSRLWPC